MVLALACAAWLAEHTFMGPWEIADDRGARLEVLKAPRGVFGAADRDEDDDLLFVRMMADKLALEFKRQDLQAKASAAPDGLDL